MNNSQGISARHLILGMSHSGAIWRAHRAASDADDFLVIPLTGKHQPTSPQVNNGHIEGAHPSHIRSLFLALYGNTYNSIAMLERTPPIWTKNRAGEPVPAEKSGRKKMHRATLRKMLQRALQPVARDYRNYRAAYPEAAIFAIGTPPPVLDAKHIETYPGAFAKDLNRGVAPASLRLAVYEIQIEIMREMAVAESIAFIPPPPEAVTVAGGLAPAFWNRDPSHGNSAYGALVLEQIRKAASQLAD